MLCVPLSKIQCRPATHTSFPACDNFFEQIFESTDGCDAPCRGDPSEAGGCGGQYVASAYTKNNVTFIIPSIVPSVGQWESLGCYKSVIVQSILYVGLTRPQ